MNISRRARVLLQYIPDTLDYKKHIALNHNFYIFLLDTRGYINHHLNNIQLNQYYPMEKLLIYLNKLYNYFRQVHSSLYRNHDIENTFFLTNLLTILIYKKFGMNYCLNKNPNYIQYIHTKILQNTMHTNNGICDRHLNYSK